MQKIDLDPASDAAINNTIINMRLKKYREIVDNARLTADVQEFSATLELGMEFIETEITDEILKDTGLTREDAEQAKRVVKCYVKFREFLEGFFRQTQIPDVPVLASFWKKMADTDTETRYSFLSSLYKKGKLRDDWMNLWDTFQKEHPAEKPQIQTNLPAVSNEESSEDLVSLIAGDGDVCEGEAALKSVDEDGCTVLMDESPPETIDEFPIRVVASNKTRLVDLGFRRIRIESYILLREIRDDLVANLSIEEMMNKHSIPRNTAYNLSCMARKVKWSGDIQLPPPGLRVSEMNYRRRLTGSKLHDRLILAASQDECVEVLRDACLQIALRELNEQYNETVHDKLSALRLIIISRRISVMKVAREIYRDSTSTIVSANTLYKLIHSKCCQYFESAEDESVQQFLHDVVIPRLLDGTPYKGKYEELINYGKSRIETCNNQQCRCFIDEKTKQRKVDIAGKHFTEFMYHRLIRARQMLLDGIPQMNIAVEFAIRADTFYLTIAEMRAIDWPDGLKL